MQNSQPFSNSISQFFSWCLINCPTPVNHVDVQVAPVSWKKTIVRTPTSFSLVRVPTYVMKINHACKFLKMNIHIFEIDRANAAGSCWLGTTIFASLSLSKTTHLPSSPYHFRIAPNWVTVTLKGAVIAMCICCYMYHKRHCNIPGPPCFYLPLQHPYRNFL